MLVKLNKPYIGMTKWVGLVIVTILTLLTYIPLIVIDRFHVVDKQLLDTASGIDSNKRSWQESGSGVFLYKDGELLLQNDTKGNHKVFQIVATEPSTYLRLEFEGSSDLLETSGTEYWFGASGAIKSIDKKGHITKVSYVTLLHAPSPTKSYSYVELIDDNTESVAVNFQLQEASGIFQIKNPILSTLEESVVYRAIRYLLTGFWVCAGLSLLAFLFFTVPISQSVVTMLLLLLLFIGTLVSETLVSNASNYLSALIPSGILPKIHIVLGQVFGFDRQISVVSKLGHFFIFFFIGLYFGVYGRKFGLIFCALSIFLLALITEVLQMLVNDRTSSIRDIYIDNFGGILGLLLSTLCLSLVIRLKIRLTNNFPG